MCDCFESWAGSTTEDGGRTLPRTAASFMAPGSGRKRAHTAGFSLHLLHPGLHCLGKRLTFGESSSA